MRLPQSILQRKACVNGGDMPVSSKAHGEAVNQGGTADKDFIRP